MPLIYNSFNTLVEQAFAEFVRQIPGADPTIWGEFSRPYLTSSGALAYSIQFIIRDLEKQVFPQTATGEFLDFWGALENLPRLAASASLGAISIAGVVDTIIPIGTVFNAANGSQYVSDAVGVIATNSIDVISLVRDGTTVTATTNGDHTLSTGLNVLIAGAVETDYNGTFQIAVTDRDKFSYTISTTPSSPATGTITASGDYAPITIQSIDVGINTNLTNGAVLTLATPIIDVDNSGTAQFDGITGGADLETDDAYRERIILSRSIIEGVFTNDQIILAALGVAGNTRAFVINPEISTCDPAPSPGFVPVAGQVVIYILRDNDTNIIPSQTILDTTKEAILVNGKLPATTYQGDVFVFAPIPVQVDFDFSALTPDTSTMRQAVINQLGAFFEDSVDFEEDVLEASFLGAIQNTQDLVTGDFIKSFSLNTPPGDVLIGSGQIGILGSVTFDSI